VLVAPFLLVAGTDSRHYMHLAGGHGALRFLPVALNRTAGDLRRVHGVDERLATSSYLGAVAFYTRFLDLALRADAS